LATELLKTFKTSGAVAFSSPQLVNKIIGNINFEKAERIIELGPGNGKITEELLRHMNADANLVALEINKAFCNELEQIGDKRLKVFNESAERIRDFMGAAPKEGLTYIVSSIPFGILPEEECDKIMSAIRDVSDTNTTFIQYSYSIIQYRRYKRYFSKVKVQFELINIPPAFVFVCTR